MKIAFLGSHELGRITLEALVETENKIAAVVTPAIDDEWYSGVEEVAGKYNLSCYQTENINQKRFVNLFRKEDIDLIVSVNFNQILKKEIIEVPQRGCINVHASLLPKYRGRAPLNWAIINGEDKTGVTVHFIDEDIDTGDIILQRKIPINHDDYISDIMTQVKEIYPEIVLDAIDKIKNDAVVPESQKREGFYCPKRSPEDGLIDWSKDSADIYNLIRAVSHPYPGAFTYLEGDKVFIWRAELLPEKKEGSKNNTAKPGEIIDKTEQGYIVKCGQGEILLTEIESEVEISLGDQFKKGNGGR